MSSTSPRNRYYSAPPAILNVSNGYSWSPTAILTGVGAPITGAWLPNLSDASGRMLVAIDSLSFSGDLNVENNVSITGQTIPVNVSGLVNSGNYGFNNTAITGSQTQIPAGSWSWSVYVESGVGFVNGVSYNTFETIAGGGYDGMKRLSSAINVGCTGTTGAPCRLLVSWES